MNQTSQLWHTILEYGKVSHSFVPNIDLYNTIGQTVHNEDVYLFAAGPSMPRQCLEKYLMSAMSPCLLVTRRPRISSAVKVTLAASTRVSLNPGQCTITWPCILHTEGQSVLTTPFLLKFFLFTSSDKFEGDHHCFFGLFNVLTSMTMFLNGVGVLTVALLPAPTPHNQQIFTLAELMKLRSSTIIKTMTSSDTPWNRIMI